jgi:hypothetical protein
MTASTRRMFLLCVRLQNRIDELQDRASEAYEFDSVFDCGEFSGPAIGRALDRECEVAARRLGFESVEDATWFLQMRLREQRSALARVR